VVFADVAPRWSSRAADEEGPPHSTKPYLPPPPSLYLSRVAGEASLHRLGMGLDRDDGGGALPPAAR
jgi:hypothetical protein